MTRTLTLSFVACLGLLAACDNAEPPPAATTKTPSNAPGLRIGDTETYDAGMLKVLGHYVVIQQALAADSLAGIADAARDVERALDAVPTGDLTGSDAPRYAALLDSARAPARALVTAPDLAGARAQFKELSRALVPWLNTAPLPGYDLVWCSMAPGGWAQKSGPIRNPYYGSAMLECGEKAARP